MPIATRVASCLLCLGFGPAVARADLLINEFLPDPAGSDAGREFVELLNVGPERIDLAGVELQFGNGTESDQWVTRWTGTGEDSLAPGERFLIVDRNWTGPEPGRAEVWLGLQNGPDALRLRGPGGVLDLVGYGVLTDPLMFEGQPVPVVPALALARRPDGRDTQVNLADFTAAEPTPGRPNFLPYDLDLLDLVLEPPSADRTGVSVRLTARLANVGTETLPARPVTLAVAGKDGPTAMQGAWPPDEVRDLSLIFRVNTPGRLALDLVHGPAGASDAVRVALGAVQVGPGPLILNEVQGAPVHREGEWCELAVTADTAVTLTGYRLRDEGGDWTALPDTVLEPGSHLVLCQSVEDFGAWLADLHLNGFPGDCDHSPARSPAGPWPSLNNSAPEGRSFADRLYLGDADGTILDHVTVNRWEDGVSLERIAAGPASSAGPNWRPSTSPAGGTPGCVNSVVAGAALSAGLVARPPVLEPDRSAGNLHLVFTVPAEAVGWRLRICDLWGHTVRDLGGDAMGPGPRDVVWDGRDDRGDVRPDGACVVNLDLLDQAGSPVARERCLVVVRGSGR